LSVSAGIGVKYQLLDFTYILRLSAGEGAEQLLRQPFDGPIRAERDR
jgi:hypothetical protein